MGGVCQRSTARGKVNRNCEPHRKVKLPLEPHGHDEHEERHARGGGQERWSGDEHAGRSGRQ